MDSSYSYNESSAQTFGTLQSDIKYEFVDCPKCGGSGKTVVYACADCGGAGMVAAGPGQFVIGKSPKAVSTTNAFDVLHLRNGNEIRQVKATKIAGDEADLRHSAGMGKYRRDDFTKEDAAKLFGAEHEPAGSDTPKEAIIDMTVGVAPSYLGACALDMKDVQLLTLLMSMGVALDYVNSPFLVLAIDKGETNLVAALLSKDASVNARDARGRSALRAAVERGDRNLVSSLLAHDADPNTRDAKSATPLHVAAAKGDVELVDYLIDHGARMDLLDEAGRTPFDYAKRSPLGKKVAEKFEIQNTDYARAKTLMAEGKFDDAIAIYGKYKDRMAVQSAKAKKGAYYESRGQLQDALQAYKEADDAGGVQRVTGLLKGQQDKLIEAQNLEKAARFDDARAAYVQAGAPDDAKRLALLLAKEMEADGDLTRAIGYYESAGDWDSAGRLRKLSAMVAKAQGDIRAKSSNDMAKPVIGSKNRVSVERTQYYWRKVNEILLPVAVKSMNNNKYTPSLDECDALANQLKRLDDADVDPVLVNQTRETASFYGGMRDLSIKNQMGAVTQEDTEMMLMGLFAQVELLGSCNRLSDMYGVKFIDYSAQYLEGMPPQLQRDNLSRPENLGRDVGDLRKRLGVTIREPSGLGRDVDDLRERLNQ